MNGRLRILLVADWYPSPENPTAVPFMRDLAQAIATRNDVTVLAPPSPLALHDETTDGIRVIRTPVRRHERASAIGRMLALNRTVAQLKRERTPADVIHAHVFTSGALAAVVGRRHRLPVVITENVSAIAWDRITRWQTRAARFAYRSAACVCPVSRLMEERLRNIQPHARYEVVPDTVDVDAFAQPPRAVRTTRGTNIVAVSNLIPRKGLHYLIEAVRMMVAEGRSVALTVVGDGPERSSLEAQSTGLPVTLLGARPRAEVVALVRAADVFAMPTLADPFGIAAVEALAAGVPVVVTSVSGTADLIAAHGGRVVRPADALALRLALGEFLDNPPLPSPTVAAALRSYCGFDAVAKRLDDIYKSLPGGSRL